MNNSFKQLYRSSFSKFSSMIEICDFLLLENVSHTASFATLISRGGRNWPGGVLNQRAARITALSLPLHQPHFHTRPQRLGQAYERIELNISRLTLNAGDLGGAHAGAGGKLRLVHSVLGSQFGDLHADVKASELLLHQITHCRVFHLSAVVAFESIHASLSCWSVSCAAACVVRAEPCGILLVAIRRALVSRFASRNHAKG